MKSRLASGPRRDSFGFAGTDRLYAVQPVIDTSGLTGTMRRAKEGERRRSTPPPELPVGRAASIRTYLLSRKQLCSSALKQPGSGIKTQRVEYSSEEFRG